MSEDRPMTEDEQDRMQQERSLEEYNRLIDEHPGDVSAEILDAAVAGHAPPVTLELEEQAVRHLRSYRSQTQTAEATAMAYKAEIARLTAEAKEEERKATNRVAWLGASLREYYYATGAKRVVLPYGTLGEKKGRQSIVIEDEDAFKEPALLATCRSCAEEMVSSRHFSTEESREDFTEGTADMIWDAVRVLVAADDNLLRLKIEPNKEAIAAAIKADGEIPEGAEPMTPDPTFQIKVT
jgi:hypothetical protein